MASIDCKVVGNFSELTGLSSACLISVNSSVNSDLNDYDCSTLVEGAIVGTLTITAYASTTAHVGDPGRAGCSVIWARKYDCDNDKVYFIYVRSGRSFSYGSASSVVTIGTTAATTTKILNASSQSGPVSLYQSYEQVEGVGLSYSGNPLSFDSGSESTSTMSNLGIGTGSFYLRSFSLDMNPGAFPVASYTFDYRG